MLHYPYDGGWKKRNNTMIDAKDYIKLNHQCMKQSMAKNYYPSDGQPPTGAS